VENARYFREKLQSPGACLGTCVTFADPTVTEALATVLDFVWIDTEHNPMSLETVQGHVMATKGTQVAPLVRVPWNDPVLIKPVLDLGAAGVIVPLIRTADDARRAVAACRYPPEGVRGFGPRRPAKYGHSRGTEYVAEANREVIVCVQIEHVDAVRNIDEIVSVPGLTTAVIGPNDLSGSLGHMAQPDHASVREAIEHVIGACRRVNLPLGIATGGEPAALAQWIDKGIRWISIGADFLVLVRAMGSIVDAVRALTGPRGN
jgi:2-keto-3-deoxy-L-rhamnonate aldolase RhmA